METLRKITLDSVKMTRGLLMAIFVKFLIIFHFRRLVEEVSVVFHSAATIKFDEDLTKAVQLNVVAVFTIIEICKKMKKLQVT